MKKRLEFVMNQSEYGTVVNTVSHARDNATKMANQLFEGEVSKEEISDFLYDLSNKLLLAESILRDIEH